MLLGKYRDRCLEVFRFYQAAIVNTIFGVSAYSLFVWLGCDMFVAQISAHITGMAFNYFTYSRHVFRGTVPAKGFFIISYGMNYLISLSMLLIMSRFVASPYAAGLIVTAVVSVINYFGLKYVVFRTHSA